jgi:chemotaxis protein CheD
MSATPGNHSAERRGNPDASVQVFSQGKKRFFDAKEQIDVVKLFSGDWYVTKSNEMLATILGSCVASCVRDPVTGIGGMNHFLLPGDENSTAHSDATRYGVFAMESLINGVLKAGARKERLEFKVFGGGNVINNSARIGSKNAAFVRRFLQKEGFRIFSEDLEGDYPRRVHYYPATGKVMMRMLRRREDLAVVEEEAQYTRSIAAKPIEGNIELF